MPAVAWAGSAVARKRGGAPCSGMPSLARVAKRGVFPVGGALPQWLPGLGFSPSAGGVLAVTWGWPWRKWSGECFRPGKSPPNGRAHRLQAVAFSFGNGASQTPNPACSRPACRRWESGRDFGNWAILKVCWSCKDGGRLTPPLGRKRVRNEYGNQNMASHRRQASASGNVAC